MLKRATFEKTIRRVNRAPLWNLEGQHGPLPLSDHMFAGFRNLPIEDGEISFFEADGRMRRGMCAVRAELTELLEASHCPDTSADEFLVRRLPSDRDVYIPPLLDRVAHAYLCVRLESEVNRLAKPLSFAFLRGRDRLTALGVARLFSRQFSYAAKLDVRRFFPSTPIRLVDEALQATLPGVRPDVRDLVRYLYAAASIRAADGSWCRSTNTLLPGPSSSPLLSQVVGHYVLDQCSEGFFGAAILRYADDVLVLGHSKEQTRRAIEFVAERLTSHSYEVHPTKSILEPLRLADEPIEWLGKELSTDSVRTIPSTYFERATQASLDDRRVRRALLDELVLDSRENRDARLRDIAELDPSAPSWPDMFATKAARTRRLRAIEHQWKEAMKAYF